MRLFTRPRVVGSLTVGLGLTACTVVLGVIKGSGLYLLWGVHDTPAIERNQSFCMGWYELESGGKKSFREPVPPQAREYGPERGKQIRARVAGRAWQLVHFSHVLRGAPALCLEYYMGDSCPQGLHGNASAAQLEEFPAYEFKNIIWWAFLLDVVFWGSPIFLLSLAFSEIRRFYRYKSGRCRECGYSLQGLPRPRCPECGTEVDSEGHRG